MTIFKSIPSTTVECLPDSLQCSLVKVPSGVVDNTQWDIIEHTQPPPPRHTLCVPLALLETFSYANESCLRQQPLSLPLPLNGPDLSLLPLTLLSWAGLWAQKPEQLGESSLCSMCCGHSDRQTSWVLSSRHMEKEAAFHVYSSIGSFILILMSG